jgi:hypothetical protein
MESRQSFRKVFPLRPAGAIFLLGSILDISLGGSEEPQIMKSFVHAALLLTTITSFAAAGNFSFTGTFTADSDIQYFTFTTIGGGTTIRTLSYGGGTNSAGATISQGGFDPLINVFLSDGSQAGSADDSAIVGGCDGGITAGTNGCLDSYYNFALAGGTYTVALTQFDNTNIGTLGDGFSSSHSCSASFCDSFDLVTARSSGWAVDIITADSAAIISGTPEPTTFLLMACGLTALLFGSRKI